MCKKYDTQDVRCKLLGHPVTFYYCRTQADNVLCKHIRNCWFERIPIQAFLDEYYSAEQTQHLDAPPKPKIASLFELIEKAKQYKD